MKKYRVTHVVHSKSHHALLSSTDMIDDSWLKFSACVVSLSAGFCQNQKSRLFPPVDERNGCRFQISIVHFKSFCAKLHALCSGV